MTKQELLQKSIRSKKEAKAYSGLSQYQLRKIYEACQHPYFANSIYRDKFLKELGTTLEKELKLYEKENCN